MAKNQNEKIIKIRLKNSDAFRKWQRLKAASNAVEVRLKDLAKQAGLPESKQFRRDCKGYLVDGNNSAVAKFTVFTKPAELKPRPACKVCRIS